MSTPGAIPRKRGLSDKLKTQIFESAMEVFAEKGYERTKVEEVAERAGLARATIYYHFRTKRDLYFFLLQEGIALLAEHVAAEVAAAGDDDTARVEALIDGHVEFFAAYRAFTQVAMLETWRLDPELDISPARVLAPVLEICGTVLSDAREAGAVRDFEPGLLLSSFFGFVTAVPIYYVSYRGEFPKLAMKRALKQIFLEGVSTRNP